MEISEILDYVLPLADSFRAKLREKGCDDAQCMCELHHAIERAVGEIAALVEAASGLDEDNPGAREVNHSRAMTTRFMLAAAASIAGLCVLPISKETLGPVLPFVERKHHA